MTTPGPEGDGVALCLSGGGYRAMVFHLGVLWRLNDAHLLGRLSTVSSVSGGSVTAAALAARWGDLALDGTGYAPGFVEHVVEPVRRLAARASTSPRSWAGRCLRGTPRRSVSSTRIAGTCWATRPSRTSPTSRGS